MKIVSILGCGWLGKPLAISLINKGFSVKGSTTSTNKIDALKSVGILPYLVDISTDENIDDFLNIEILIIAITSKNENDFLKLISKIEASSVEKVIFISSTSVYPTFNKIMTEKDETINNPLARIEKLFFKNNSFKTTIIRFAGLFDAERHPANWFKNGRKIPQPKGFVNMIHKEDCISIIEKVINQNCWNQVFNACSNHHPTRRDFYTKAKLSKGLEAPEFIENEELKWKIISSDKLQKMLNYQFTHNDLLNF